MNAYRYKKLWWVLGFLGLALILGGSLMPSEPGPPLFPHFDKTLHFSGYLIATYYFQQLTQNQKFITVFSSVFVYSGLIEVLQNMMPTRQMSGLDLVANFIGCAAGTLVSLKLFSHGLKKIDRSFSDLLSR